MLNFQNADLLSLSSQNTFLGDGIFRIGRMVDLTIEGNLLTLSNQSGVSGIMSGVEQFLQDSIDWQPVILNGIDFGSGRVIGWEFDAGTWVRSTRYTCNIQVYESGDIFNMTGSYYSGLQDLFNNPATQTPLIRDLQESFDFEINRQNEYSYNYQVSLGLYSGVGSNPIQLAQNIASGLLFSSPPFGFINNQWSGFYQNSASGKTYFTENYNTITNQISVGKTFKILNRSGCYSILLKHSCQTNEDGITQVQENADILGFCQPIYNSALSGLQEELPKSYGRCSGMYEFYAPVSGYPLISEPISKNTTLNSFDGRINYTITYTTNPFYFNSGYYWEYTQSIAEDPATIINVSENGLVRGYGKLNTPEKFNRAVSGYNVVLGGVLPRASGFYFDFVGYNEPLHLIARDEGRSPYRGEVTYSREYTDDPTFIDDPYIQRSVITINQTLPKHIFGTYNVLNHKELVQIGGNTELAADTIQISLNTQRSGGFNLPYYIDYCKSICTGYKTGLTYNNIFYRDAGYNFSDIEGNFDFSLTYLGASGKEFDDLNLGWT